MLPVAAVVVAIQSALAARLARHARGLDDGGQTTAEYALVLLGAAAIALLLVAWATKTDAITRLLNGVLDRIMSQLS